MPDCFICGSTEEELLKHQDVDKCRTCISEFQAGKQGLDTEETNTQDEESEPELEYENNLF
jgi:hypothetical protein